jgi:hypothetical protein
MLPVGGALFLTGSETMVYRRNGRIDSRKGNAGQGSRGFFCFVTRLPQAPQWDGRNDALAIASIVNATDCGLPLGKSSSLERSPIDACCCSDNTIIGKGRNCCGACNISER